MSGKGEELTLHSSQYPHDYRDSNKPRREKLESMITVTTALQDSFYLDPRNRR